MSTGTTCCFQSGKRLRFSKLRQQRATNPGSAGLSVQHGVKRHERSMNIQKKLMGLLMEAIIRRNISTKDLCIHSWFDGPACQRLRRLSAALHVADMLQISSITQAFSNGDSF